MCLSDVCGGWGAVRVEKGVGVRIMRCGGKKGLGLELRDVEAKRKKGKNTIIIENVFLFI